MHGGPSRTHPLRSVAKMEYRAWPRAKGTPGTILRVTTWRPIKKVESGAGPPWLFLPPPTPSITMKTALDCGLNPDVASGNKSKHENAKLSASERLGRCPPPSFLDAPKEAGSGGEAVCSCVHALNSLESNSLPRCRKRGGSEPSWWALEGLCILLHIQHSLSRCQGQKRPLPSIPAKVLPADEHLMSPSVQESEKMALYLGRCFATHLLFQV